MPLVTIAFLAALAGLAFAVLQAFGRRLGPRRVGHWPARETAHRKPARGGSGTAPPRGTDPVTMQRYPDEVMHVKPPECTCGYPAVRFRNGSGHAESCPVQQGHWRRVELEKQCAGRHHWHDTGVTLTSNPPLREQVCCHCGAKRLLQDAAPARPPACGPFAGGPTP